MAERKILEAIAETEEEEKDLSVERTELAEDRTLLANERTFSAWIRTGLAALAGGVAIVKLIGEEPNDWRIRFMGVAFTAVAVAMFLLSFWRYRSVCKELTRRKVIPIPNWMVGAIVVGLLMGTGLVYVAVFL